MVIFVGSKNAGYFAKEVAEKRKFEIEYIKENQDIKKQSNDILFLAQKMGGVKFIVYDVDQYINDFKEIVSEVEKVSISISAKPIILVPSLKFESKIVREFLDKDIKRFVVASNTLSDKKDEFEKCLTDFYMGHDRKEIKVIKEKVEKEKENLDTLTTIAVAGTSRKIGCSLQCFQIVKYLNYLGYKACYFEMNENRYTASNVIKNDKEEMSFCEKIKTLFNIEKEEEKLGKIVVEGVDIFYDKKMLGDVLKLGYEYIVYDYGDYKDKNFNKYAFLKDDINIFITSSYVSEIDKAIELAMNISYKDAKLVFSFTSEDEKDNILSLFNSIKVGENYSNENRCYFAGYSPSLFMLGQKNLYDEVFNLTSKNEENEQEEKPNKRISLFKRKGSRK